MHKLILIAAMVFVSATAQAGSTRTLITQASNEEPVAAEQGTSEAPKYVARPSATTEQPKSEETKPAAAKTASTPRAEKPRRRSGASTEARVIYELHRHGIYW
jgi:hypothetical protein